MLTNIEYRVVRLAEILDDMKPLLEKHYEEVAFRKDKIAFNPDYDKYLALDDLGMLHCVGAFKGGELIGYFLSIMNINLHYKDHIYAANDVLYIAPEHRAGRAAYNMFRFAEKDLASKGVSVLTIHMKTHVPFDRLCESLGYTYLERIYAKYIQD